jgi:hypothetical protein
MRQTVYFCVLALGCACLMAAQGAPDDDKLLTTFQNPLGNLISVPFQNNVNFPVGQFSRVQDVLNIQPVVPFNVTEDWLLITRWITPVVYQPNILAPAGGANGLGDEFLPVTSPSRQADLERRPNLFVADRNRSHAWPREMGNRAIGRCAGRARALDDRLFVQ